MKTIEKSKELVKQQDKLIQKSNELIKKQGDLFGSLENGINKLTDDYNFTVNLLHNLNNYDTQLFTRCSDMIGMLAEIYDYASKDLEDLIADLNERLGR